MVLWIVAILLSVISLGYGLLLQISGFISDSPIGPLIFYALVVPILLIGGMAFITAGRKKKKDES